MYKLKIGIVGCGAIGSSLAKILKKQFFFQAKVVALYDKDTRKARELSKSISKNKNIALNSLERLISSSQLVIEAASGADSWEIVRNSLSRGRSIMVMSAGGLVGHLQKARSLAVRHKARVYIPSGAISGIDALKAAKMGGIKKVFLTTIKNPRSFQGVKFVQDKKIELDKIMKDTELFSGTAKEAVKYFPQNINVAAVLSLAGIGQDKTYVKIIASPKASKNIHEINFESNSGRVFTRTENLLHPDNPKTSFQAVLSAVAVLKQIFDPVVVGT